MECEDLGEIFDLCGLLVATLLWVAVKIFIAKSGACSRFVNSYR